jgi:HSP20 family molecular chaperone IbpA
LLIIVEIPGINLKGSLGLREERDIDIEFNLPTEELIISGKKHTCYIPYDNSYNLIEEKRIAYDQCYNMHQRESSAGWQLRVPVPRNFKRKVKKASIRDGILQVLILPEREKTKGKDFVLLS